MAIRTSPYEATRLRKLKVYLDRMSGIVDRAIEHVEASGKPLYVFKQSSQEVGMQKLMAFAEQLDKSLVSAQAGDPLGPETLTARARKPDPVFDETETAEQKSNRQNDEKLRSQVRAAAARGRTVKATKPKEIKGKRKQG